MTAPHFFADAVDRDIVRLAGAEAIHAARALRIQPGERITVSDGAGRIVEAEVRAVKPQQVEAVVVGRTIVPAPSPRVVVYVALPKSGKLELVVQKLTELGVDAIRPWPAERSVVRWDARKAAANTERLRAIAREAAKQSRRAWLPVVDEPAAITDLPPGSIVLHEEAAIRLSETLPGDPPDEIALVIGPEGGLSPAEVERFVSFGARAAGLGPQILRAETAAIIVPALVLAHYGRIG